MCKANSKTDVGKLHRDVDFWNLLKEHEKPLAPFKIKIFIEFGYLYLVVI